jgi:hypothetical protein
MRVAVAAFPGPIFHFSFVISHWVIGFDLAIREVNIWLATDLLVNEE